MISAKNLSFNFQPDFFIENMNFEVKKGAFCAILGPNGSGKTTLIKLLCRQLKSSSGEVVIDNTAASDYSYEKFAKTMAVVPQQIKTPFHFTVYETVMMGRNPYQSRWCAASEEDKKIVMAALEKTNLLHLKERYTNQLSGGELQRTLIARAIAQQTPIILLDEPLSNLDVVHKYEIMDILSKINREEKRTIVIILHDFSFALQYASETMLMKGGKLIAYDKTSAIFEQKEMLLKTFSLDQNYHIDPMGHVNKV